MTAARLAVDPDVDVALGGTVTYRVTLDGTWVGWVGDERRWRGSTWGGRRWWACWRQDGDSAARWNTFSAEPLRSRGAAVAALLAVVAAGADGAR